MENPTCFINCFGRYKVGINKFLLSIKISLFCWFAGAQTTAVFISLYLKSQGLTIADLSLMFTFSVVFQFIAGLISGVFADKIGRVKPFLFIHGSIFLIALTCFTIMPKLDECAAKKITFDCIDEEIRAMHPCQILLDNFHTDSCTIVYKENETHYDENQNCPFVSLLLRGDNRLENGHFNETSGFCLYQVGFKNYSTQDIPSCDAQDCNTFQMICSSKNLLNCQNNRSLWIILYGILIIIYNTSGTNVYRFFDVITMDLTNQYNSDFGKHRLWSILGILFGPPLAGFILHVSALDGNDQKYTPAFVCSFIFTVFSLIPVWNVNPKFHKPAPAVWKKTFEFVMNTEILLFLILLFTMGISFGFLTIYGRWYLQDLGASDFLIGAAAGVSALCGLPLLYASKWILIKAGLRNFFVLCLLTYTFYCFSLSFIREPLLAIAIEVVNVFAYYLFWVAAIEYCDKVAPVELQATMKVLAGSLHYNTARLGATAIGGYVMKDFGGRVAYRVTGGLCLGYAIFYGTYLIIERLRKKKVGV
ncbi:major facilitator superfamily domain-containing protein 6-like [Argiope bruennichi]|uniref:major facilitator superfamily domain-containing protein 6-like n=1 Tax=Argiope bruennichi TaxID=94029 RepID=UPI002493D200|nr:major facilitator superfamily domain-containing protein 6-like [Argiope bruennichi]